MVKIVADTLSCIPVAEAHSLGIEYIPQIIEFGAVESYRDDTEIDSATFLKKLRAAAELPKTAAPPPALYGPVYQRLSEEGHTILVISPSAQVSGTYRSAEVAAQDFPSADIRIIDTKSLGSGLGRMVLTAHRLAKEGQSAEAITSTVLDMASRERIYFLVDTMEYLAKGGRIGKAKALMGGLLQVKPLLTFRDGHTEVAESQRTKKKATASLFERIRDECPKGSESQLTIMQGDAEEEANFYCEYFQKEFGLTDIPIFFVPPAILVHSGPGVIGVSFFKK